MSFPVCFWYDFKAASKMTWKREESAAVAGVWDMKGVATGEERKNPDDNLPAAVNAGRGSRVCGATAPRPIWSSLNKKSATADANVAIP